MWSIVKAQLFQLRKNALLYIVFLCLLVFQVMVVVMFILTESLTFSDLTMGGFLAMELPITTNFSLMFSLVASAIICCADFSDKTINYEPMNGHSRSDSYFGRAVISVVMGLAGFYVLTFLPPCILGVTHGWGDGLDAGTFLIRALLMALPVIRLMCEFVFLCFVAKNMYAVILCGFLLLTGTTAISGFTYSDSPFMALTSLNLFTKIGIRSTYGLMGNLNLIYEAELDIPQTAAAAAASIAGAALFLFLGYVVFRNDDLN